MPIAPRNQALLHSRAAKEPTKVVALLEALGCKVQEVTDEPKPGDWLGYPGLRLLILAPADPAAALADWLANWDSVTLTMHSLAILVISERPPKSLPPAGGQYQLSIDWCPPSISLDFWNYKLADLLRRVQALDALEDQRLARLDERRQHRNLLDRSIDMIVSVDNERRITEFNESARTTFGYTLDEVLGQPVTMLYDDPDHAREVREILLREGKFTGEIRNRKKNGEVFYSYLSATVVKGEDGSLQGSMGIARDMSGWRRVDQELRRAKEQAEAANRTKSQFLANMSHEMRTPISAVIGYAELLEDQLTDKPELIDYVDNIRRNSEHLLRLINDILDLSKVEIGKLSIERIPCNPCSVVSDCFHLLRTKSLDKGVHFRVRYRGQLPQTIRSDPTRILQCLVNLADNAIKFTPASGEVSLECDYLLTEGQPQLRFVVRDTGIGIPPESLSRILRPFEQGDTATTRKYGGTGLGLSITKRLAEMLGGELAVDSVAGQGSAFTLTIGCGMPAEQLKLAMPATPEEVAAQTRRLRMTKDNVGLPVRLAGRILLAEDFPDTQRLLTFILEKAGAKVEVASTGTEALSKGLTNTFDLILMDMLLPEMDGITAVRQLRDQGYTKPIIALTASTLKENQQQFLAAGCNDVAIKPLDRRALVHLASTWLTFARQADAASQKAMLDTIRKHGDTVIAKRKSVAASAPPSEHQANPGEAPPPAVTPMPRPMPR